MQLFGEDTFFVWLAILSIPAFLLGIFEKPLRHYGMAVTALFLFLITKDSPEKAVAMLCFAGFEYLLAETALLIVRKGRRPRLYCVVFLILSITPLVANKVQVAAHDTGSLLMFAGISYMTFKAVQIIIEIFDGVIQRVSLTHYLYLLLFFPTLLSGPIDRSRRFEADISRTIPRDEYLEMAGTGLYKILLGMVYKLVIASVFHLLMKQFGMPFTLRASIIYFYTYGFYLFFDFAGYSLMAIGTAYLFGVRVPENFDKPFLSKDIHEFWDRWHITLSHWLRDYVFSRITMNLIRAGWIRDKLVIASIALIINMLIMGCWHGLTADYILYGLYHGILLAVFEVVRKKSGFYKKHRKEKWFQLISWFVTLHLVLIGFCIFSGRFLKELSFMFIN